MYKKLSEFKIDSSIARTLAEQAWGRGGTHSYKTTRKGIYYFSCSGHGGYVVDKKLLDSGELHFINKFVNSQKIRILGEYNKGEKYVLDYVGPDSQKTKWRANPITRDYFQEEYEFYLFEEDCAWSILEKFTGIRSEGFKATAEERKQMIDQTFMNWYGRKQA
jgi:hypothetical protein